MMSALNGDAEMDAYCNQPAPAAAAGIAGTQTLRLDALIRAADGARPDARRGMLFASASGRALVNAAFDLFECDDLYRLGQDVGHELEGEQ